MAILSWLHLTDFHAGQHASEACWETTIEDQLHRDLRTLHRQMKCRESGGWDVVFFTGDLVNTGTKADFDKLNDRLKRLWKVFKDLDCAPVLLAVPGNHDLKRPVDEPWADGIKEFLKRKIPVTKLWQDGSKYRPHIEGVFTDYVDWYAQWRDDHAHDAYRDDRWRKGLLPGEFSTTIRKGDFELGVVGLNTAFLQLSDSDESLPHNGNLVVAPEQVERLTSGGFYERTHARVVLTHHPRSWLSEKVRFGTNIAPANRFLMHLFGHAHVAEGSARRIGGGETIRTFQGAALSGFERAADGEVERIHGYSCGHIEYVNAGAPKATLRLWPRIAKFQEGSHYYLAPDWDYFRLNADGFLEEDVSGAECVHFVAQQSSALVKVAQFVTTLIADVADIESDEALVIVNKLIGLVSGDAPLQLLTQARLLIERYLLCTEDNRLGMPGLLELIVPKTFSETSIAIDSKLFSRAAEREGQWSHYFALLRNSELELPDTSVGAALLTGTSFLAPQYLIAGLLSRFDENWKPVLDVYSEAIADVAADTSAEWKPASDADENTFARVQASQWICWLIWGPSIPLCTCPEWRAAGTHDTSAALQLGYGDENNSLPAVETPGLENALPIASHLIEMRKCHGRATPIQFTGRMVWSPTWFAPPAQHTARAQRRIFEQRGSSNDQHAKHKDQSDGLSVLIDSAEAPIKSAAEATDRSYFSAYQWLMFLVATPPKAAGEPPTLLWGRRWPSLAKNEAARKRVASACLWSNLLPVFVHANIADNVVFEAQRHVLIRNALTLLDWTFQRREKLFPKDHSAGIRFYLVGASDYSGCGFPLRFPVQQSLAVRLKDALDATAADSALRECVVIPELHIDKAGPNLALQELLSACHLPEMIADYYQYVNDLPQRH